jgi:ABC-2 type transport system permease protein
MFSFPLFRTTVKSNYVIWFIFAAILMMYFSIIATMYDPEAMDSMEAMLEALPPQLVEAMNFSIIAPSLLGFLAGYFYGFLILFFPLIYMVIMADRMIAKHVDNGSMAFLLSTPNSRAKIAFTQAVFLVGSLTLLIGFVTVIGILVSEAMFAGELEVGRFVLLNVGAALLYFALSGIGFLASCLFNQSRYSLALGGGLPVLFFLVNLLAGTGEQLSGLKYVTLLTLFDPTAIVTGGTVWPAFATLVAIGLALYGGAMLIFSRKDLPL